MILPNDVLYIILGLLRDERDYSTLYQCALSSRFLAEYALMLLYQYGLYVIALSLYALPRTNILAV